VADPVDPDDAAAIGRALSGELLRHGLVDLTTARTPEPVTAATSTWVFFIQLQGPELPERLRAPLVLRVYRPAELHTARTEFGLAGFLRQHGYPAPANHLMGDAGGPLGMPWLLQERCPGVAALDAVSAAPWAAVATVRDLAALQARLHALPLEGCPLPVDGPVSERYLTEDLDRRRRNVTTPDPSDGLDWLHATAPRFADRESVLCHGDFHPLNVLVDRTERPVRYSVIDWTDAAVGDPHFDVARSLAIYRVAGFAAPNPAQRRLLGAAAPVLARLHRRAYERASGRRLDDRRLAWWQAVHVYRGWLQLTETREGAVVGPESSTRTGMPDDTPEQLLAWFSDLRTSLA
jgi:aminoglycoside phosphotransferase (APT) family kinase protein